MSLKRILSVIFLVFFFMTSPSIYESKSSQFPSDGDNPPMPGGSGGGSGVWCGGGEMTTCRRIWVQCMGD